ncbi:MAG: IS3 family transposase [Bacteroidetes bacterium]|nr:IS3 family transposase [Bacteroidota bacterium]
MSRSEQRAMIDRSHGELTIAAQCAAVGLPRSTLYYKPRPAKEEDLRTMRLLDELHLEDPTRGTRRLCLELQEQGMPVGRAKVRSLMRRMRLGCVYRRPRTTVVDAIKHKHPYLLKGLVIDRPHQVWAIDITYVPIRGGYMYLCAIIDLYSRYIVGWSVSNTMEAEWVCTVVRDAASVHGRPEIINSDQGSQFTSDAYQKLFKEGGPCQGVRISMDGKGRAIDNVFIERFWRTLKHEHIYLRPPEDGVDLCRTCSQFIHYYNHRRKHSSIGNVPPIKRLSMAA